VEFDGIGVLEIPISAIMYAATGTSGWWVRPWF